MKGMSMDGLTVTVDLRRDASGDVVDTGAGVCGAERGRRRRPWFRRRRDEEGGVADEAAMIAIVLAAAVLIGGIVMTLISQAGDELQDTELPTAENRGDDE